MASSGQLLRSERIRRNKTVADIASATCISRRYLEAIETDDVRELPGEFFYKAFLRQYAKALDLDAAAINQIVASAIPIEEPDPVPALNRAYRDAQTGRASRWAPPVGVAAVLLVTVLAAGSSFYSWWQTTASQKAEEDQKGVPQQVQPIPAPDAGKAPEISTKSSTPGSGSEASESLSVLRTPVDKAAVAEAAPQAQSASIEGTTTLEVSVAEPTWLTLRSAGKTLYIGTMQPSESHRFAFEDDARLLTGNAGSVDVRVNGKPIGSIGPRGQIRTVLFSGSNVQVLDPRVKSPGPSAGIETGLTVAMRTAGVYR